MVDAVNLEGRLLLQRLYRSSQLVFTAERWSERNPALAPPGDYRAHLLGDAGCCVVNKSLLYQRPPLSGAPLIFISDSDSHESESGGARGAAPRSFNFLLWETEGLWGSGGKQEAR